MFDSSLLLFSAYIVIGLAVVLWLYSLVIRDVSIVDSFWSIMIMIAGIGYLYMVADSDAYSIQERHIVVGAMLIVWATRLSAYITMRNRGHEEDARYQEIRRNNEPHFEFKSLYIVFLLQAFLALIVSLPIMSIATASTPLNIIDYIAICLWLFGMVFEVVGDMQLKKFRSNPDNKGRVLDTGLWRYTRHPNYFGEFCIWWAFFLFALAGGEYWSIISPILMSILLLKVSGVSLLEKDISERRPAYQRYRETTNAFFPWFPSVQKEDA